MILFNNKFEDMKIKQKKENKKFTICLFENEFKIKKIINVVDVANIVSKITIPKSKFLKSEN